MISEKEKDVLIKKAKEVLEKNWEDIDKKSGFTKPSAKIYPFQWNWDSGFIAYAYTHYDLDKAVKEYRALFSGQWSNGFLPHILFHKNSKNYFPDEPFWRVGWGLNKKIKSSGITQPPIHAMTIWHIYKAIKRKDLEEANFFLKEFFPKLYKLNKYFMDFRDPEKTGCVTIYHPWESGMDNSPRWDAPLGEVNVDIKLNYKRIDNLYVDKDQRPSDETYDKFVYLVKRLKRNKYSDSEVQKDHPFLVKDVLMSSILYVANNRLLKMAEVLGEPTEEIKIWKKRFESNFREVFQGSDKFFYDFDLLREEKIEIKTIASITPIITGLLNKEELKLFIDEVKEHGLIPSTDVDDPTYDPDKYWRGPIWVNINWIIWKGFMEHGLDPNIYSIRDNLIKIIKENGFYEYFHNQTGKGIGVDNFSWTAALLIDLLNHEVGF